MKRVTRVLAGIAMSAVFVVGMTVCAFAQKTEVSDYFESPTGLLEVIEMEEASGSSEGWTNYKGSGFRLQVTDDEASWAMINDSDTEVTILGVRIGDDMPAADQKLKQNGWAYMGKVKLQGSDEESNGYGGWISETKKAILALYTDDNDQVSNWYMNNYPSSSLDSFYNQLPGAPVQETQAPQTETQAPQAETQAPQAETQAQIIKQGYLVPDANTRYLSDSDVSGMDARIACFAKNEIYARHGRQFVSSELSAYFNSQPWYSGTISPNSFSDSVFNEYEMSNIQVLLRRENSLTGGAGYALNNTTDYTSVYQYLTKVNGGGQAQAQTSETQAAATSSSAAWKDYYTNWINTEGADLSEYATYSLIKIDSDEIPEMLINTGFYAGGDILFTYAADGTHSQETISNYATQYMPGTGLVYNSSGHQGGMWDNVYKVENGTITLLGAGSYIVPMDADVQYDENDHLILGEDWGYVWDDQSCTKDEYQNHIKELYSGENSVIPYDDSSITFDRSAIFGAIQNY